VYINTHEQYEYGSCREGRGEERGICTLLTHNQYEEGVYSINTHKQYE
jgi:hypothetical protein